MSDSLVDVNSETDNACDVILTRYISGLRTYIITLKFPDLAAARDLLEEISYGGDCWEFRVDLLRSPSSGVGEADHIPSLDYVRQQLRILQELPRRLPILFTVRTVSQGGRFPDDAGREALLLMKLAAELGCEYIDVEITWPSFVIDGILAAKGTARIVASFHEFSGQMKWTSWEVQEKCMAANVIGDIIKLCIQSMDICDGLELGLYIRDYQKKMDKPLIAVAMGPNGQISRFLAPITFVTHKLIPAPPGSDQLYLSDINRALHLLGQLPRRRFCLVGSDPFLHSLPPAPINAAFEEQGLPYSIFKVDELTRSLADAILPRPDFGGAYLPASRDCKYIQSKTPVAAQIGFVDTIVLANESGQRVLSGTNTTWMAIQACLDNSADAISAQSIALIFGANPNAYAACYAIERFGIRNAILVGPDEETARNMSSSFARVSFRRFARLEQAVASIDSNTSLVVFVAHDAAGSLGVGDLLARFSGVLIYVGGEDTSDGASMHQARRDQIGMWKVYSTGDVWLERLHVLFKLWTGREALRPIIDFAMKESMGLE